MKKLTVKTAKLIAVKYSKKHKDKIEQEFAKFHPAAVAEVCALLSKKSKADTASVVLAAWVHDIGSTLGRQDHAKHSVELLEKECFILTPTIRDCILNHSSDGRPKTKEGKIIQAADKIAIIDINVLKALFKQKNLTADDISWLIKMTTGAIEHLKKIKF